MNSTTSKSNRIFHWITLLPLMLLLGIVPSLVQLFIVEDPLYSFGWTSNNLYEADLYLHCKNQAIIFLGIIMVIFLIIELIRGNITKNIPYVYLLIGVYALLALGSAIFSQYSSLSFSGIPDHFESVWVILSYCVAVFYAFFIIKEEKDLHWLLGSLAIGTLLIGIVGISQAVGHNLYEINWITNLIMPAKYRDRIEGFSFNTEMGVSASLYNPNYVGVYGALVIPIILFCIFIYLRYKNNKIGISSFASLGCLAVLGILGYITLKSQSAASAIALCGALFLFLLILYIKFWNKVPIRIAGFVLIGIVIILGIVKFPAIRQKLNSLKSEDYALDNIIATSDYVSITYKNETLRFSLNYSEDGDVALNVVDALNNPVKLVSGSEIFSYTIENSAFSDCEISLLPIDNYMSLYLVIDGHPWIFSNEVENNNYLLLNDFGNWVEIQAAPSAVFTNYTELATKRGYIWSRTIPLLPKTLILGTGPDTFATIFPQYDYVARLNAGYTMTDVFTKPHNLFLQIGIQTGVLSLLCVLAFYLIYFIKSIQIYSSVSYRENKMLVLSGLAIFLATFSYMVAGLANDSMVVVAPVFWVLLGIGIKINYILAEEPEEMEN